MFDTVHIVQSAASSFNNAALVAPSFFWSALLMLPLFALVYKFGNDFVNQLKWTGLSNKKTRLVSTALCVEVMLFAWLILMHGNYAALREVTSYLPFINAGLLFVITASMFHKLKSINPKMPDALQNVKNKGLMRFAIIFLIVGLAGLSGMPTIWGFAMQAAAVLCGALVGRAWKKGFSPISLTTLVMFGISIAMLMQPEFFRFGQLSNLTFLHILFLLVVCALTMAIISLRNIKPRGRVHQSAYIKLKWMMRIVSAFCLILFVLTESVPVFLGLAAVFLVSTAMSVWHLESVPEKLSEHLWALLLFTFGIMTSLPVIAALGILYWINLPKLNLVKQSKFLL